MRISVLAPILATLGALLAGAASAEPRLLRMEDVRSSDDGWYSGAVTAMAAHHPNTLVHVYCEAYLPDGVNAEGRPLGPRFRNCAVQAAAAQWPESADLVRTIERRARPIPGVLGAIRFQFRTPQEP